MSESCAALKRYRCSAVSTVTLRDSALPTGRMRRSCSVWKKRLNMGLCVHVRHWTTEKAVEEEARVVAL